MEVLPCGCVITTDNGTMTYQPCNQQCEYFQYFLQESIRQGKPPDVQFAP